MDVFRFDWLVVNEQWSGNAEYLLSAIAARRISIHETRLTPLRTPHPSIQLVDKKNLQSFDDLWSLIIDEISIILAFALATMPWPLHNKSPRCSVLFLCLLTPSNREFQFFPLELFELFDTPDLLDLFYGMT